MTKRDYIDIIVENLEGGYYHPNMKNKLVNGDRMGNSGETMFGLDRLNGKPSVFTYWNPFWELVDSYYSDKHNDITYYNDKADGKHGIPSAVGDQLRNYLTSEMFRRFELFCKQYQTDNGYLSQHEINYIITHPSILLNMLYAVYGGVTRFRQLATTLQDTLKETEEETEVWKALQRKRLLVGNTQAATNLEEAKKALNQKLSFNWGAVALVIAGISVVYLLTKKK